MAAPSTPAMRRLRQIVATTAPLQPNAVAAAGAPHKTLQIDLTGKVAFIAGVADFTGYGWAIAKELANAGATILVGTWPPMMKSFAALLAKPEAKEAMKLDDGSYMQIAKIYPFDAVFDTAKDIPEPLKLSKGYAGSDHFSIQEVADQVKADFAHVDILIHSLANGPEVQKPLLETSRKGYLAASSSSAYSLISMLARFGPLMRPGGSVISLSYIASERVVPGYGGGMSSAKAQLESDTRTLAWEAGRKWGVRVNCISAGGLKSRAANAIGKSKDGGKTFIERVIDYDEHNAPLTWHLYADHVGASALCLVSDLMAAVTGQTLYVDMGMHVMGTALDSPAFAGLPSPPQSPVDPNEHHL